MHEKPNDKRSLYKYNPEDKSTNVELKADSEKAGS